MLSNYKYLAFITYAHKDEERARWLRKKLEGFRVPPHLIGSNGLYGPIPSRLYPIFRDRDELAGSAQLGPLIEKALEQSSHLIVLCSPNAVNSRWVNEEIRLFKKMGKADRVLCLVLEGEPMAEDTDGDPENECIPLAARREIDQEGNLTERIFEPGAADLRPSADGESDAILKIVAGLVGVGLDEIKQRDLLARQKRMARFASIACFLAISAIGLASYAFYQQREASVAQSVAISERKSAEEELDKTKTITNFVQNLFLSLDPQNTAGMDTELLKTMLDQGSLKAQGLLEKPDIEASIRVTLGKTYRSIGSYEKAQNELQRALKLLEKKEALSSPVKLEAMNEIAMVHEALGNYLEAQPLLTKLIELRTRQLGEGHNQVMEVSIDLATVNRRIGKLELAEDQCTQTLSQLNDQNRSKDDPLLLKCMTELAKIYLANDKIAQGESLSRNVYERTRLLLGENHSLSLKRGQVLVEALRKGNKLDDAENLSKYLVSKFQSVLGDIHPDSLGAMDSLAEILAARMDLSTAIEIYLNILELKREALGFDHPETIATMKATARLHKLLGDSEKSLNLLYSVYERLQQKYGYEHPETLRSMNELAGLYMEAGKNEEALKLCESTLALELRVMGEQDPMTLQTMFMIGKIHHLSDRKEEAMEYLGETLAKQEKLLGFDNAEATRTRDLLNLILSEQAIAVIQLDNDTNGSVFDLQGPPLPGFLFNLDENSSSEKVFSPKPNQSNERIEEYLNAPPVFNPPTIED